jgi:hypothetical protein
MIRAMLKPRAAPRCFARVLKVDAECVEPHGDRGEDGKRTVMLLPAADVGRFRLR